MTSTSNSRDELKAYLQDMNDVVRNIRNQLANLASKGDVTELEMEETIQERHIENIESMLDDFVTQDQFAEQIDPLKEQVKQLQKRIDYIAEELDEE